MLNDREEEFIRYWEQNRDREKRVFRQLALGLPIGITFGLLILFSLTSGWYSRAVMVANAEVNPAVILVAILAIAVFTAIFYKKLQWEKQEQQYQELLARKARQDADRR